MNITYKSLIISTLKIFQNVLTYACALIRQQKKQAEHNNNFLFHCARLGIVDNLLYLIFYYSLILLTNETRINIL